MAEVFLCQRGQLDNRSKRDLRAAGVVVVEVDEPDRCQFIRSTEVVGADDMIWAALDALWVDDGYGSKGNAQRERLATNLFHLVVSARRERGQYVHQPKPKAAS